MKRKFEYDRLRGKITSNDASLKDFYIRYLVSRYRYDVAERWILFWRGRAISFSEAHKLSELKPAQFTSDKQRVLVINKMGMGEKFDFGLETFVVPPFKGFSTKKEQSEFISLLLEALSVYQTNFVSHPWCNTKAIIGDQLQKSLADGIYLL